MFYPTHSSNFAFLKFWYFISILVIECSRTSTHNKMKRERKRKLADLQLESTSTKSPKPGSNNPYPDHTRPTREQCVAVRDDLLALHGFPKEFIKYRNQRLKLETNNDDEEKETVLDGLVKTILSQNTTEKNSDKAFASLKMAFPTWEQVLAAESKCIEDAIRCGGLAPTKSACIKNLLKVLLEKKGELCMEYLRKLSTEEIKEDLSQFKGIGPKTLQKDDFPVDTHVFQIAKTMGWVPTAADIKKTYIHLNERIPAELKFDLNCLLYTHGKICKRCSSRKVDRTNMEIANGTSDCPLLAYC